MKFLILNGPNVNIMRWSEPGVPGELDYNAMMDYVQAGCDQMGIETDCCQSNHEGDLVDEIQAAAGRVDGIVLNPGAQAHDSAPRRRPRGWADAPRSRTLPAPRPAAARTSCRWAPSRLGRPEPVPPSSWARRACT